MNRWFAVSACGELPRGHVAHTQLLGQELVLWRSTSGALNAWENRCPHRGVRLTLGTCTGEELRCQYHAWRFATGSGQCTHIPAHPNQKPAGTIRARVFAVAEDGTFAWVNLSPGALSAAPAPRQTHTALRSIFANAPVAIVREVLLRGYAAQAVIPEDEFTLQVAAAGLEFMLQPVSDAQTFIHARLQHDVDAPQRLPVFRHHNALMSAARDRAEAAA